MPKWTPVWRPSRDRLMFSTAPQSGPKGPQKQCDADVAQLVERNLAKVEVASSSLVVRS